MIKNLPHRYPEIGRIRFGEKGPKGEPRKGKTLRFSTDDELVLKAIASQHGGEVRPWPDGEQAFHLTSEATAIAVLLPPEPVYTAYERWGSGGCQRRCDGEQCTFPVGSPDGGYLETADCQCLQEGLTPGDRDDAKKGACIVTVRLRVVLPEVPGLGVWMATSHSIYAAMELPAQVALIEGSGAGWPIPAELAMEARSEKKPWENYRREYVVPVLRIRETVRSLGASGAAALQATPETPALGPGQASEREPEPTPGPAQEPNGAGGSSKPFLRVIKTKAKAKGFSDQALASLVEEATGRRSVDEIDGPQEANAVLDLMGRG